MLLADKIEKRFGPQLLFRNLSWQILPGQRIGLIGPNGAGKTTLVRILAGSESPDAGQVQRAKNVRIGYLPQEAMEMTGGTILEEALAGHGEVTDIEIRLHVLAQEMADSSDPATTKRLTDDYGTLQERFAALGGYDLEARARAILTGLGFDPQRLDRPIAELSGGWQMRVALARLLLQEPDLLLLDEPTNHLDLESLDWLEEFLLARDGAFVVISHDRYFLNRMVDRMVELTDGRMTLFKGNYDTYQVEKERRFAQVEAAARQQTREIERAQRFIGRFRAQATKARQVQSRIRMLEKMEKIEMPVRDRETVRFQFPQPPRGGAVTIQLEQLVKRYGDNTVYAGVDFRLQRGDRVALLGPNGAGKSTLLKVLAGVLPFEGGRRTLGHNVSIAYYAQHALDALDPRDTVIGVLSGEADVSMQPKIRGILAAFLFDGDEWEKRVAVLSGGEKARLALAKLLLHPANLLLLDEPTNHLDLRSRDTLEEALSEYTGTLCFISHDRYFINKVSTSVCDVEAGRLEMYLGGYDDYHRDKTRRAAAGRRSRSGTPGARARDRAGGAARRRLAREKPEDVGRRPVSAPQESGTINAETGPGGDSRRGEAASRKRPTRGDMQRRKRREAEARQRFSLLTKPLKDQLETVETKIANEERKLRAVEFELASPSVYENPQRARSAAQLRSAIREHLAVFNKEWEALSEQVEAAERRLREEVEAITAQ